MKNTIKVDGMKCQHCANNVKEALLSLKGINNVSVNLDAKEVTYDTNTESNIDEITKVIGEKGYKVI